MHLGRNHDRARPMQIEKANWKYKLNASEIQNEKGQLDSKVFVEINYCFRSFCDDKNKTTRKNKMKWNLLYLQTKRRIVSSSSAGKYDLESICVRSTNLFYFYLLKNFAGKIKYNILFIYLFFSVDSIKLFPLLSQLFRLHFVSMCAFLPFFVEINWFLLHYPFLRFALRMTKGQMEKERIHHLTRMWIMQRDYVPFYSSHLQDEEAHLNSFKLILFQDVSWGRHANHWRKSSCSQFLYFRFINWIFFFAFSHLPRIVET